MTQLANTLNSRIQSLPFLVSRNFVGRHAAGGARSSFEKKQRKIRDVFRPRTDVTLEKKFLHRKPTARMPELFCAQVGGKTNTSHGMVIVFLRDEKQISAISGEK